MRLWTPALAVMLGCSSGTTKDEEKADTDAVIDDTEESDALEENDDIGRLDAMEGAYKAGWRDALATVVGTT